MVENYDILLTTKSWDSLNVDQIMTSKVFLGNENSSNEEKITKINENTPEDNICVICFDKKIELILNKCLVINKIPIKIIIFL